MFFLVSQKLGKHDTAKKREKEENRIMIFISTISHVIKNILTNEKLFLLGAIHILRNAIEGDGEGLLLQNHWKSQKFVTVSR